VVDCALMCKMVANSEVVQKSAALTSRQNPSELTLQMRSKGIHNNSAKIRPDPHRFLTRQNEVFETGQNEGFDGTVALRLEGGG